VARTQWLTGRGWETVEYAFQVTYGGPNVWIHVNASRSWIEIFWGTEYLRAELSEKAHSFLETVFNYLYETS